mmetsp:Transcript_93170/g.162941  ORF Transcript_93170/g.162941 Transcript_93170/m.162941 type:complete len:126 (-) Transcript_93170:216-593(-)
MDIERVARRSMLNVRGPASRTKVAHRKVRHAIPTMAHRKVRHGATHQNLRHGIPNTHRKVHHGIQTVAHRKAHRGLRKTIPNITKGITTITRGMANITTGIPNMMDMFHQRMEKGIISAFTDAMT